MSKEDEQQAIHAISAIIAQWWREHSRNDDPPESVTSRGHDDAVLAEKYVRAGQQTCCVSILIGHRRARCSSSLVAAG
jgi:hypothetical protein